MQERQDRQRSMCLTTSARRRPLVLQHVLDQVDAAARANRAHRRAAHRSGRSRCRSRNARRRAEFFRLGDVRIGELSQGESWFCIYTPAHIRPGLSTPLGSKLSFTRLVNAASGGLRLEHLDGRAHGCGRANQRGVAAALRRARRRTIAAPPHRRWPAARSRSARRPSRRTFARRLDSAAISEPRAGAPRRANRRSPDRPHAERRARRGRPSQSARDVPSLARRDRAIGLQHRRQRLLAMGDRRRNALEPERRHGSSADRRRTAAPHAPADAPRPTRRKTTPIAAVIACTAVVSSRPRAATFPRSQVLAAS